MEDVRSTVASTALVHLSLIGIVGRVDGGLEGRIPNSVTSDIDDMTLSEQDTDSRSGLMRIAIGEKP